MGLRFQKRIKILPGITLNLSKSGISTSLGVKGARVTLGHGKTRTTVGIPGSGISHTTIQSNAKAQGARTSVSPLIQADAEAYQMPPVAEKVGRFLYKALGWVCAIFIFLMLIALLIQHVKI